MFLRSNQGDRLDGNESVADSFEVIWSALKAGPRQFSGLFTPSSSARKPPQSGSALATQGQSHPSLSPSFEAKCMSSTASSIGKSSDTLSEFRALKSTRKVVGYPSFLLTQTIG
ncbi:hypothetical protein TNCV_2575031 [Trichonephila clavipes]|nr:hypothetical protein TNCV_2575031 [Trichonephila clavipes]